MKQENNTGGVFSIAEMSLLLKISARSLAYWFDSNSGLGILPINKNKKSRKENLFSFKKYSSYQKSRDIKISRHPFRII